MNMLIRRVLPAVVSSLLLHTGAHAGFQPIALFGEEAPGTGGATFGNLLGTISVAGNGDITFWSTLNGATSDTDTAAFRVVDGVVSKIIQQGDEAPGLGGPTFDSIGGPVLSDSGVYAMSLRLDFGGEITFDNDWGLWADFGSGLTNIAQEGDEAPGLGGALFDRPGEVRLSTNGDIAFFSRLKDVGEVTNDNDGTLWRRVRGGDLELLAREGDAAAGIAGSTHRFFNSVSINASGDALYSGSVQQAASRARGGATIDITNNDGLWLATKSGSELLIREGDAAPGIEGGILGGGFSDPQLNDSGDVAFVTGTVEGKSVEPILYASDGGEKEVIAKWDTPAPGTGGRLYNDFLWPRLNASGDLAFGAYLQSQAGAVTGDRGSPDSGLFVRRAGESVEKIAITGDTAPDTGGALFEEFRSPLMGASGDVVFQANLQIGGDVDFDNNGGLWAYLSSDESRGAAQLIKLAREGDDFEVGPGDVRTISFISVEGINVEAVEPSQGLNALNQLGVRLGFTDGSVGVFLVQVPAPGSVAVLGIAGIAAMRRRR